jgi:hypothetical protein
VFSKRSPSSSHDGKDNERHYGKVVFLEDIIRKGNVTIPEGSGILDLHKKLAALEAGEDAKLTREQEAKETLRKAAAVEAWSVEADMPDEIWGCHC